MKKPKAIVIDVIDPKTSEFEAKKRLEELENLVNTFGGIVVVKSIQKKALPDYKTYIGSGKLDEILEIGKEKEAQLLIVNNILKPSQSYNLKEALRKIDMEAWDRVDLILKIFEKHADTTEAKLQVNLASIKHMGPRIFGMGMELSRQEGAVGVRSGSGEANIEMMKRHLRRQELKILEKLKHYELIHEGHRKQRKKKNLKTVALVGYTNSGKSSLLHAITKKKVYIADELFATLDTRVGKIYIENQNSGEDGKYRPGKEILMSDTIGFIRDLPPDLIQAFKSTLAETINSDFILHVIDITDPEIHKKIKVVEDILDQLGLQDKPKIYVFNKIDLIHFEELKKAGESPEFDMNERAGKIKGILKAGKRTAQILGWHDDVKLNFPIKKLKTKYKKFSPVFVSAKEKEKLDNLIEIIDQRL